MWILWFCVKMVLDIFSCQPVVCELVKVFLFWLRYFGIIN
jgi:hypothetical protein